MSRSGLWGGALLGVALTACSVVVDRRIEDDAVRDGGRADGGGRDAATIDAAELRCDPNEEPRADGVFVSASATAGGEGTASSPVASFAEGLRLALDRDAPVVYLHVGRYAEGVTLTLDQDLEVRGGWRAAGGEWRRDCSVAGRESTVVAPPSGEVFAVVSEGAHRLQLSGFTIVGADGAAPGESSYGLRFRSDDAARLALVEMTVRAGRGAAGAAGSDGVDGDAGDETFETGCSDGASGVSGAPGAAGAAGAFDADGYVPRSGGPGGDGTRANNGTPGGSGQTRSGCQDACGGMCVAAGAGCAPDPTPSTVSSSSGRCGEGGGAGTGGGGGGGGGGSFGVYASGFAVVVEALETTIAAGDGGDGGAGGRGGLGGSGLGGQAGTDALCPLDCGPTIAAWPAPGCACTPSRSVTLAGGGAGGPGGTGGDGGNGGGGAGGPSVAVVLRGGATLAGDPDLDSATGGAGAGGAPNGPAMNLMMVE